MLIPRLPVTIFPKSHQNRPKSVVTRHGNAFIENKAIHLQCYFQNKKSCHINQAIHQNDHLAFIDEKHAIRNHAISIKSIFGLLNDGEISPSPYDTAWVSLIEDVNGLSDGPQFPSSLEWIVNHQHSDGSWGDPYFSACDRLLATLACVVALTTWKIHPDKCDRGIKFVEENLNKLGDEKEEHITDGFEILFPALIDLAQNLEIKVPNDSPILKELCARRDVKLLKIPKDKFHKTPTILLYSLEGMKDLDWGKLLKLQSENGAFLYSPAATAFAFMQTKDQKCLSFLTNVVKRFNGGVPHVYPVEIFERLWMVDRLQRLGISRYFYYEIKDCVDYIYRYWNKEQGLGFTRNCNLPDLDDTAMGFRILRTNGYQISPDVFRYFEEEGKFLCYHGQTAEAVTVMLSLYRASQVLFPGENLLADAKKVSYEFLTEKRSRGKLLDKWVIAKDLPGEVGYALDVPWYANLPRLEARYYLEHYGGESDVWLGKSLYRMRNISNNTYLEMAKLDYNYCQAIHQMEWSHMQKWYAELNIENRSNTKLLWSYYEAAASIFEPEKFNERLAWARTTVILHIITSLSRPSLLNCNFQVSTSEIIANSELHDINGKPWKVVMYALHETINQISSNTLALHGVDIKPHLHNAWNSWLSNRQKGVDIVEGGAELTVQTIYMSSGRWSSDELLSHPKYQRMSSVLNDIYHQISHKEDHTTRFYIENKMEELVELVLCDSSDDLDFDLKQTFLAVAKTIYYKACFDPETINHHAQKVLFEKI
uniref:ent-kaurene synthase n=1 Tax=Grindelia hirsutula TaxID=1114741 RepID=R9UPX9_9ASTR|nr:labda-13-en-8-ol diphosphate synthase [Grindelia hirsutula]